MAHAGSPCAAGNPDVWTLALINHDFYRWQAGQFALVKIGNSDEMRAYTLSSTPGQSPFITLTVRQIEQGKGSGWLTRDVRRETIFGCPILREISAVSAIPPAIISFWRQAAASHR
ncbi:hypothetical protein ERHA55_16020 [Erwinia rhapontici]|nr:hypothetical protein ERHA55_16020 [Erwinia rhapontici]